MTESRRPLIIAHRGASAVAPENTIATFRRARELGADGVELAVTLTRDHIPVVIHDDTVDRTTSGHGEVSRMTLSEMKEFEAGAWKGSAYRGELFPTLSEVLDALLFWLKPIGTAKPGIVNFEIKSSALRTSGIVGADVSLVENWGLERSVIPSSFISLISGRSMSPVRN